jgi:tape measure domain-containing protein
MPERKIQVSITGINQATGAFQALARDLDNVSKKAAQASQAFATSMSGVSKVVSGFSSSLGSIAQRANVFSGLANVIGGVGGALKSAAQQAVGFAGGLLLAQGISQGFGAAKDTIIGFNASLEQSQQAWSVFLKSGDRAEAMLFQMQKFAAATPFRYMDVEANARALVAQGFAVADVFNLMTDIGNLAAAYGGSKTQIDGITYALGQMHTAGRLNAQDVNILNNVGVPAWEILATKIGKTVGETRALSEAGQIAGDVMIEAVREFSKANFGDMMALQMKTFVGSMSTIWDSLQIVGSTAFRPLFDRLSEAAQRFSEFVSGDSFMAWGASVAATVDVVMSSLGDLAGGFADAMGGILNIVLGVGQVIYEALSWLNPWAEHSPSLVTQVKTGADAIGTAYEGLSSDVRQQMGIAGQAIAQFGSQPNMLKTVASDAKDAFDALKGSLSDAEGKLRDFMQAPLKEAEPFDKRLADIQREQDRVQLQLNKTISGQGTHRLVDTLTKQLDNLRLQAESVQLEKRLKLGPLEDQLEALTKPKAISFLEKIKGIKDAQKDIATLTPKVAEAEIQYKGLQDAVDEVGAAASKAAGALGNLGSTAVKDKLAGIDELLADSKKQLDEWKAGFESAKQSVLQGSARIRGALDTYLLEPIRTIASLTKTIGAPGGGWGQFFAQLQLYWDRSPFKQPAENFMAGLRELPGRLQAGLGELWSKIDWGKVWATAGDISGAVGGWLGEQWAKIDWDKVWAKAGDLAGAAGKWIEANSPAWGKNLEAWTGQFLTWADNLWTGGVGAGGGLESKVGELLTKMRNWIRDNAPTIAYNLAYWTGEFVGWVIPAMAQMIGKFVSWYATEGSGQMRSLGVNLASSLAQGFWDGLTDAFSHIVIPFGPFSWSQSDGWQLAGPIINPPSEWGKTPTGKPPAPAPYVPPPVDWQAEGGPVLAGRTYGVGERGPELFIPSVPGIILPHNTPVGGGVTVQFAGPLIGTAQISKEVDLDVVMQRLAQWVNRDLGMAIRQGARSPVGLTPRM